MIPYNLSQIMNMEYLCLKSSMLDMIQIKLVVLIQLNIFINMLLSHMAVNV